MIKFITNCILGLVITCCTYAGTSSSPAGFWITVDDVTHQPESIIKISETSNHSLQGVVIKNLSAAKAKYVFCTACEGRNHNQPIIGMTVLWGFELVNNEWKNGRALDPTTGKIYRCKMKLLSDGNRLRVRGYIGVPLLGRTQTWIRTHA